MKNFRIPIFNLLTFSNINSRICVIFFLVVLNLLFFSHIDLAIIFFQTSYIFDSNIINYYDIFALDRRTIDPSYPITTFLLIGLWLIPVKLLGYLIEGPTTGGILIWCKILVVLFFVFNTLVISKILKFLKFKINFSDTLLILLSSFWVFFPIIIFTQVDIFGITFLFLGMYYLLKKNIFLCAILFGISITFKPFPLLAILPILFLLEKNIGKLILAIFILSLPYAILTFLYHDSDPYRQFVLGVGLIQNIFQPSIAGTSIKIYPFIYSIILFFSYSLKINSNNSYWIFLIPSIVYGSLLGLISIYPHWMLYFGVFFAISLLYIKDKSDLYLLECISIFTFLSWVTTYFSANVDIYLVIWGPIRSLYRYLGLPSDVNVDFDLSSIYLLKYLIDVDVILTLFVATLFLIIIVLFYSLSKKRFKIFSLKTKNNDLIELKILFNSLILFIPAIFSLNIVTISTYILMLTIILIHLYRKDLFKSIRF